MKTKLQKLLCRSVVFANMIVFTGIAFAEVKMPEIFGDHMVLQEGTAIFWGEADPKEKITVTYEGVTAIGEAGQEGKWKVELKGLKSSDVGKPLKISGNNTIQFEDVLIPIELKKVQRLSPTLGRPAPAGADILFANGNLDQWEHKKDQPATWRILPEGVIECVPYSKDIQTKKLYKDFEMHLEFKMPYEPDNTGQDRGNSGLFIQGVYEIQILDSYGVPGSLRDCGAIYRVSPPKINMSAPPEQWQTYDIIFKAARFDESGKLLESPIITVKHNDTLIHHLKKIKETPTHAKDDRKQEPAKKPGPLKLQDHKHPVQFRNFWILEN
jgi:hypothetical protein